MTEMVRVDEERSVETVAIFVSRKEKKKRDFRKKICLDKTGFSTRCKNKRNKIYMVTRSRLRLDRSQFQKISRTNHHLLFKREFDELDLF